MSAPKNATRPPIAHRRRAPLWRRIIVDLAVFYGLICLVAFVFQKSLVYYPIRVAAPLRPAAFGFLPDRAWMVETLTSDGIRLHGWHIAAKAGRNSASRLRDARLVDLFFSGNWGNRSYRGKHLQQIASLGADVVCFDYQGFGDNLGSPDEEGLDRDAWAGWKFLRESGVAASRIVIHGESLGGGVATRLAAEVCDHGETPGGLILEATFSRLAAPGAFHFPYLPVRWLLTQRFESAQRLPHVTCPILQFHGSIDTVVPFPIGLELFRAAPPHSASGRAPVFVTLPHCRHLDAGVYDAALYETALRRFFAECSGKR